MSLRRGFLIQYSSFRQFQFTAIIYRRHHPPPQENNGVDLEEGVFDFFYSAD